MWGPSRFVALAIVVAVPIALANCSKLAFGLANGVAHYGAYERRADITYGTQSRNTLDVYIPSGARNRPMIIFWYGGMWTKGSKAQYRFVGAALANAGYVAVLPDYRLFPEARFPEFIEDGAQAVRWAHEHAAELGGDADAIFLMGHSAGAHVAASIALDNRYLKMKGRDTKLVRGFIGLSGPYALQPRIRILEQIFREPYTSADWQPVRFVNQHSPPTLLLHGADDWIVKPREMLELEQKLRAVGAPVESHMYKGGSHWDTISAFSLPMRAWTPVLADVRRFVDRTAADTASAY